MSVKPYIFDGAVLTGAAATYGTAAPSLTARVIRSANLVNTTGAPVAATVYMVPATGAPVAANTMISARTIAVGESYPCPELIGQGLNPGGTMQALGNGLTFKYTATDIT